MKTPKTIYDYPCWADLDLRYCDTFCLGRGCSQRTICKAYRTGRSANLDDDPSKYPYKGIAQEIYSEVPKERGVCEAEKEFDFKEVEEEIADPP